MCIIRLRRFFCNTGHIVGCCTCYVSGTVFLGKEMAVDTSRDAVTSDVFNG